MREVHERAKRAAQIQEVIVTFAVFLLVFLTLGSIALRGDEIRAHRLGISVEQLQSLDQSEAQIEQIRQEREERCGHACIQRIDSDGESWE